MKICKQIAAYVCFMVFYLLMVTEVEAQQEPQYTEYMYNTMTINPAYTGSPGTLEANLLYRDQWIGVDGAPETQSFGIHFPLANEKVGLGFNVVNDKIGPSSELFLSGNYSYTIQPSYRTKLAFGLKAGLKVFNVDFSKGRFYDQSDILLSNNIQDKILPVVGAGVYYYSNKWYVGLSVPNFFRSDYYDDIEEAVLSNRLHYYIIGGYVFNLSDNLKFKPATLVKIVSGSPITVDISANFLIQETITLGASYRYDDAVSGLVGFQLSDAFLVGYSYDYTTTDFTKYNDGTHEIILRYKVPQRSKRIKSPRFF